MWITKWWAQIIGWFLFPATVATAAALVDTDLIDYFIHLISGSRRLLSPRVQWHQSDNWGWSFNDSGDVYIWDWLIRLVAAGIMVIMDIIGWIMFYVAYKDSL